MSSLRLSLSVALLSTLAACASTSPAPAFKDVANTTELRSGQRIRWDQNTTEDAETARAVEQLLDQPLTDDSAVQIALLASPRLRSTFEELSIAQADLVQAGLLKNPVFSIGRTAWESEHISPNLFVAVEQDFLDIITLPLRKRVAKTELEARKLEVADEVLELAGEVRHAFYTAQAAEQVVAMRRLVDDAAQTSAELATRQHEAGNMSDLALTQERGLASQTRVDRTRSEGEAAVTREHLAKVIGAWGHRTRFRLGPRLPEMTKDEVDLERLETIAIGERLDVAAARRQVQALDYALSLAKTTRWTGTVTVGVQAGRLRGSQHLSFGPSASIEVPLFDQRQAAIARLEATKRQAENHLQALSIDVRSDVRAGRARVLAARAVVEEYGKTLVPMREQAVRFSQEQYDAMLLGVYQLLLAKQAEYAAYREYIEALRDYWIARSDLERAVGRRLTPRRSMP
jgi:cobalt-zinc-cadmium efflux system outer membrane protein